MISPKTGQESWYKYTLAAILVLGVLLRVIVVLSVPTVPVSDFWSYFQRAISLADRGVYEAIQGRPDASYPPGYPLLLSLFFRLPFDRLMTAKILNIVLSGVGLILTSAITEIMFNKKASIVAGFIYVVNPRSILSCVLLASENLFIPLVLLWVFLLIRNKSGVTIKGSILSGFILGLSTLTRSISWLLSIPWIISLAVQKLPIRKIMVNVALFLVAQAIVLLPWGLRNASTLGQGTFLTTTSGINLFIGNNQNAEGEWYSWVGDIEKVDPAFESRSIVMQNKVAENLAITWMEKNPIKTIELYFRKLGLIFKNDLFVLDSSIFAKQVSPPWPAVNVLEDNSRFIAHQQLLEAVVNGYYWIFLALGLLGVVHSFVYNFKDPTFLSRWCLIFLSTLYFPLVAALFLANSRFHWPSADLLIPFAGGLITYLFTHFRFSLKKISTDSLKD